MIAVRRRIVRIGANNNVAKAYCIELAPSLMVGVRDGALSTKGLQVVVPQPFISQALSQ